MTQALEPTNRSAQSCVIQADVSTQLFSEDLSTVAKPDLGAKRQCQSCATKFYDLNKDPIVCPKCGAIFQVVALARAASRDDEEEEAEIEKKGVDTVSLDEVEAEENAAEVIDVDDDVEIEDDADDTFLEEDETEDDDVTGLIDGDIETDEES
ncbi:hypothetical protein LBMAG20_07080 [Methylocystaceae bacterium]|nr:hypothetical protein LBMAG20_07080 [Methylocystaceae bacterium]